LVHSIFEFVAISVSFVFREAGPVGQMPRRPLPDLSQEEPLDLRRLSIEAPYTLFPEIAAGVGTFSSVVR
jgi:hypothetical protein